jgi:hypothetical protein
VFKWSINPISDPNPVYSPSRDNHFDSYDFNWSYKLLSKYCTVLEVLVGLQTTPLNYSQAFIADYTVGITIVLLQTVPTLTVLTIALPDDSRVPPRFTYCTVLLALLTVDSRPSTVGSWLLFFLAAGCRLTYSLAGSLTDSLSEIPVLKWACADGIVATLSHRSYTQCTNLVTGETSVVYFTWVAVSPF